MSATIRRVVRNFRPVERFNRSGGDEISFADHPFKMALNASKAAAAADRAQSRATGPLAFRLLKSVQETNQAEQVRFCDRREFLCGFARYAVLAVIAVVVAATRKQIATPQACVNRGICGSCASFAKCELPAALTARQRVIGGKS